MAKAPAKPEAEEGDAPAPKRGKKLLIILIVLVVLLLITAGGVVFLLMSKKSDDHAEADTHADEPPKLVVDKSKPPTFAPLEPFTVNLQPGEGDHYLQAVIQLKVVDPHVQEDLKVFMPEIRHRINLLLSSKLPSEVADIEGRENLAEEIMIETNYVLGFEPPKQRARRGANAEPWGPVLAVLFDSFIVQ
ncbi:MAG: flagellar basal body-associated FliL family protein [Rhodocyclaceae bacterium]|nr:flagellar basal body-associated FliL family protein [Rhodocyclaceae bacterium]